MKIQIKRDKQHYSVWVKVWKRRMFSGYWHEEPIYQTTSFNQADAFRKGWVAAMSVK